KDKPISARKLLKNAHDALALRAGGREAALPRAAMPEIADDSDGHRTRTGNMRYERVTFVRAGGKPWGVAYGTATGYPAQAWSCDLIAVPLAGLPDHASDADIGRLALERLNEYASSYFKRTLLHALSDGAIAIPQASQFHRPFRACLAQA